MNCPPARFAASNCSSEDRGKERISRKKYSSHALALGTHFPPLCPCSKRVPGTSDFHYGAIWTISDDCSIIVPGRGAKVLLLPLFSPLLPSSLSPSERAGQIKEWKNNFCHHCCRAFSVACDHVPWESQNAAIMPLTAKVFRHGGLPDHCERDVSLPVSWWLTLLRIFRRAKSVVPLPPSPSS